MMMSSSQRNAYSYGDALYWDARYLADGSASFDWYQRYTALRRFVRKYVPVSARVLMVGCGNAVMSEDMVKDGYIDIMNIDISSVVTEMMRKKYTHIPQLRYMQMDVRDMSFFDDESFDCVIDKGTLDSLMCGVDATLSASRMLEEVNRLLRPGGIYILITYGDPSVRIPRLNQPGCNWNIILYIIREHRQVEAGSNDISGWKQGKHQTERRNERPGFQSHGGCSSQRSIMEPVPLTKCGQLPSGFVLEDPDSHYIYVCEKEHGLLGIAHSTPDWDCSSAMK